MAIKQVVPIFIQLTGDGSSTVFTFALANVYQQGFGGSVPFGTAGVVPSTVVVNSPPVPITSSTIDANGNITITFTSALPAAQYQFELDLTYNSGSSSSSSPTQAINVNITGGSSGNGAASNTGAAVPTQADYIGVNIAGTLTGVTGLSLTNSKPATVAIVDGAGTQITSFGGGTQYATGTAVATPTGTASLGWDGTDVRVLSTNASGQLNVIFPSAQAVTLTSTTITGTVATTQSGTWTNTVTQATAANLNATVIGTGTFAVQAAQSGTWNIGTLTTVTNPVTVVGDSASGAANAGNPVKIGGAFNTTQPTVTNGQTVDAQMTARGAQIVATGVDGFNVTNAGTFAVQAAQSGTWTVGISAAQTIAVTNTGTFAVQGSGTLTHNNAAPTSNNVGVLPAVASTAAPTYTTGDQVLLSTDLAGNLRTLSTTGALADLVGAAGTLNAANATATINAFGYQSVGGFLAAGTLIGTIVPEVSFDGGTTWTSTYFDIGNKVSSIVFGSANTATSFSIIGAAGASNMRVRVSAFTSGTATCTLRANDIYDPTVLFTGTSTATTLPPFVAQIGGSVVSTPPTYTGGTLNAATLDTSGNLRVASTPYQTFTTGTAWASGTTSGTTQLIDPAGSGPQPQAYLVQLDQGAGFTAGAITFQVSADNINWVTINAYQVLDPTTLNPITLPYTLQSSTNKAFLIHLFGYSGLRIEVSTTTAGGSVTPYWMSVNSLSAPMTSGIYQSTIPVLAAGQSAAQQVDTTGSMYINQEGRKQTYSAAAIGFTPIATTTGPTFSLTGSSTKTVRITKIRVSCSATSGGVADISLKRFSALSGGTSAAVANIGKLDTNNATATAAPLTWSVVATTATLNGVLRSERYEIVTPTATAGGPELIEWNFGIANDQALVLRGTSDFVGVLFSSVATTPTADIWFEWTEE